MRNKKVATLLLVMCLTLTGCTSEEQPDLMKEKKEDLVSKYETLASQYNDLSTAYQQKQEELEEVYKDKELNPGVTTVGDGTGTLTLHSVNEMLQFNSPLAYPDSTTAESASEIKITDRASAVARDNWVTRLVSSNLELQHSSGISGVISVQSISQYISGGNMKELVLAPWISQVTNEPVSYRDIFISNNVLGYQGTVAVTIDENTKSTMVCGIAATGMTCITYVFVYDGESDDVKNESINSVVESIKIENQELTLS